MTKPKPLTSPIKYPGGKRKLFAEVEKRLPKGSFKYAEPFFGGGSIGVRLAGEGRLVQLVAGEACGPVRAFWEALAGRLRNAAFAVLLQRASKRTFEDPVAAFTDHREALNCYAANGVQPGAYDYAGALLLTLNKTCMNGLVRFNSRGEFNVPIGRRQDGSYYRFQPDFEHLDRVRAALVGAGFQILSSWKETLNLGPSYAGWVVYLDPPYTGGFVDYTPEGWSSDDDIELYEAVRNAAQRGARVILSQPDTEWARDCCASLLKGWQVDQLEVGRPINSDGQGRGPVRELLIWNKPAERVSVLIPDRVTRIFKNLHEEPLSGSKADLLLTDDMIDEGPV
jgi:DNA adenine methylase